MLTKKDLLNHLAKFNIRDNSIVITHVSLRAIGKIDGGAQTLLDALIERFAKNGGLLCVPTHTWDNFYNNKEITLDCTDYKTSIGVFANIAAADARGKRTHNPTHSVCLFGEKEKVNRLIALENAVDTPTSPYGVYGEIVKNGYALLIGVGQEKNTALHAVEEYLSVKNRLAEEPATMTIRDANGLVFEKVFYYMWSQGIEDVSLFFPKYEPAFRYYKGIIDGEIGNAQVQLTDLSIAKSVMEKVYKNSGGVEILSDDTPLNEKWYK